MNKEEFITECKNLEIEITEEIANKLEIYATFLLEYNTHTNLTAIKTKEEVYLKHFYDSLTLTKIANFENQNILDIGTGAGFPGLVLAIVFPKLNVTLLDSNNKKITFLKECIQKLNLNNVEVIYSRAEDFTKNKREYYDYVTSRAVAELRILLEISIPSLKINGYFLGMKGNVEEELKSSANALEKLKSKLIQKEELELPNMGGHRTLLKIKKESVTENIYPRTYDKIKKKPL